MEPDLNVKLIMATDLGNGVDLELANTLAEISQPLKAIFAYDSAGGSA